MISIVNIRTLQGYDWDIADDNIDVEIETSDSCRYWATFFTLRNLASLFNKNRRTGECARGTYLWSANMIIVEDLNIETIRKSIEDLIKTGEIDSACHRIA